MTTRLTSLAAAVFLLSPLAASGQNPLVDSLEGLFEVTRTHLTATAQILTEEQLAFRPTDDVRTAGQILAHVADANYLFCSSAAGEANPSEESLETTRTTKAGIVDALARAFAYCETVFDRTTDAEAPNAASLMGQPNTVGGILAFNSAHNYEHYGNLVTYMRINGIVPPSSR